MFEVNCLINFDDDTDVEMEYVDTTLNAIYRRLIADHSNISSIVMTFTIPKGE